jgi:hypothetical protein
LEAATQSYCLDVDTIRARNTAIDNNLAVMKLQSIYVIGDGNCLFRAISVCVYGDETYHSQLRKHVTSLLSSHYATIFKVPYVFPVDKLTIYNCIKGIEAHGQMMSLS